MGKREGCVRGNEKARTGVKDRLANKGKKGRTCALSKRKKRKKMQRTK